MGLFAQRYHWQQDVPRIQRGRAATKDWLRSWDWFRIELEELVDAGEKIVALTHSLGRARGTTSDVVSLSADVWTMRDGKAIGFHGYDNREKALRAVGLRPETADS
jgi:ketosteroid isomerase-like protein